MSLVNQVMDKIIYIVVGVFVIFGIVIFALIISANHAVDIDRLLNPEKYEQEYDQQRIKDFEFIKNAIKTSIKNKNQINYCPHGESYCEGKSNENNAGTPDGTGWVKVDLRDSTDPDWLPTGPFYNDEYFYRYCSDNQDWEINTRLTSKIYALKAEQDGGTDPETYEVGTDLGICK